MNKSLAEYLQSLSETDLYPLIRDLLRAMGYKQVTITHGPLEVGRDLVFLESDPIGRHIWRGVQVKTDSLTGSLATEKGARAVINQCEAALDTPYTDPNGQEVSLFEVWLVSPYPVSDFAKLSIKGKQKIESKVHIIEGPRLCDLVEEFIPDLIESGSKPIEKYLRALIAFCDSPEEYLSTKMKMTYSISDIFIDPLVAIELIKGDSLLKKEPLSKVMRCEELKSKLNFVIPLLRESLLPAVEFYFMSEQIKNLSKLSKALSSITWYKESSLTFREALQPLLFIIGINEKDEHSAFRTQSSEKSFASCMEYEILEEFEGELCCLTHPEIEILKTYASLNKLRSNSVRQKGNSLDEELWVKAESGRGQFLIRLLDAYKGSIDQLSSMNQVVTHVRKLIYEKKIKNKKLYEEEIKSAHDSITKIIGFLEQFDSELRQRYKALYSEIFNIHMQPEITTLHHELQTVTELGQLTSFTDAFYGKTSEEDYNRITFDALTLASSIPRLVFRGALGMGKTTLSKRLCHEMARKMRDDPSQKLPVLAFLSTARDERNHKVTKIIADAARESFHSLENFPVEEVNWVLDGFDEIESSNLRERILEWCTAPENSETNIILSSRPSIIPPYVPGLTPVALLPFSPSQIKAFIERFPWRKPSGADQLLTILEKTPDLFNLAQSPLLLTLITILSQYIGPERLPKRKEEIYRVLVKLLMGDWDFAKGVERPQTIQEVDLRLAILRRTAYALYSMKKRSFTKNEFVTLVTNSIPASFVDHRTSLDFLDDLIRDCIIIPLSREEFGFFHFSIQEYLAAEELAQDITTERVVNAIQEYFRSDGWWEETLVFYAGIKRDVSVLINELHRNLTTKIAGGDTPHQSLVRLLRRWFDVADFTKIDSLNPRGSVAKALTILNVGAGIVPWEKYGKI